MRKFFLLLCILLSLPGAGFAQNLASPYSNAVFPAQIFTTTGQTGKVLQLNGLTVASTVGSSFASGTITVTGVSLTTVTFTVQGSSDNGVTFFPLPVNAIASPGTLTTVTTATASGMYQVSLAGLTHVRFVTSSTFTATSVSITLTASPNALTSRNSGGGSGGGATLPSTPSIVKSVTTLTSTPAIDGRDYLSPVSTNAIYASPSLNAQACINAAATANGICVLPPNYNETLSAPLTISSLTNFTLSGGPGSILHAPGISALAITNGSNITVSGITFDGGSTGTANGITVVGTSGVTFTWNGVYNFGGKGLYVHSGFNLDAENNNASGNGSDVVYGENWTGAKVLKNNFTSLGSVFRHAIAFHGSFAGDAATLTSTCTIQTVNITSIVGAAGTVTVTTASALPTNVTTMLVANIAGTVNFNGFYVVTITGANTFTFPSNITASEATGTVNAGTVTAITVVAGGANFATTGNLQFINGQETAGGITSNITTGTWNAPSGTITGTTITNGGFCNSNPAIHANNNDLVQNIEVAQNTLSIGSAFCVEIGAFGGQPGIGANVHDNQCTKGDNSSGYGGYSFDTMLGPQFTKNSFTTTIGTAPNLAGLEIVNSPNASVTGNFLTGAVISQNGSSFGTISNNVLSAIYAGQIGIYNGSSDFNKPNNQNNVIVGNTISFQAGVVPAAGIETQANGLLVNTNNTIIANNTMNVSSGVGSGNALIFSCAGLGSGCSHLTAVSNTIGPWQHAYSISTAASGSLNLNDDGQAVDTSGHVGSGMVYFNGLTNQQGIRSITFDGSSSSILSNLFLLSLVSQSAGGVFNISPSTTFSAELMQSTFDNLVFQGGNGSNPRSIFLCGSSDTVSTNCPAFFNDSLTIPAGNYVAAANGTNGYCFSGTGACWKWNVTLSAIQTAFAAESENQFYIHQTSSGFWNRFTQIGTLTANQSVNLPAGNSATAPSLTAGIGNCADGFSSTTAAWTTTPCLPLYTPAGTLQTGSVHSVNITGTYASGTLAITFAGSAAFTSASSYSCAVDNSTAAPTYTSGTSVTFTGTTGNAVRGHCIGN